MSEPLVETIVHIALFIQVFLVLGCGYRAWRGPEIGDRLLAIDLMTTLIAGIIVIVALIDDQEELIDLGIALAALSFIATVSLARYVSDGKVF